MMSNPFKCYCILAFKYNKYITEQLKNQLEKGYNLVTISMTNSHFQHFISFFQKTIDLEFTPYDTILP